MAPSRIEMLLGFIAQKPSDPFPRYALALEYKNADRLDEARGVFSELMSLCPDYTATYLHAGELLSKMGLKDDARAVFRTGISVSAKQGDTHARGELEGALSALAG
jgi:tetratricopeptide (TPR) repeat protein